MLKCPKQLPNLSGKGRNKHPDCFQGCSLSCQCTYCGRFFMLYMNQLPGKAFLSLTKITEFYFNPFISTLVAMVTG